MKLFAILNLDEMRIALPLQCVDRVVRAVELTALPSAPGIVLGMINVAGRVIPVVNMRQRFRLPERSISLTDHFIIARTSRRTVALVADMASGVIESAEQDIVQAEAILHGLEYLDAVIRLKDGLVLIHNLDRFLSLEEDAALDRAMAAGSGA